MTSKDYLKQIAESDGVCPLTNDIKNNASLFPIAFENIYKDLDRLEKADEILEIFIRNVYYDNHNHCVKMREIRKSRFNFDYEDLKEWLEEHDR